MHYISNTTKFWRARSLSCCPLLSFHANYSETKVFFQQLSTRHTRHAIHIKPFFKNNEFSQPGNYRVKISATFRIQRSQVQPLMDNFKIYHWKKLTVYGTLPCWHRIRQIRIKLYSNNHCKNSLLSGLLPEVEKTFKRCWNVLSATLFTTVLCRMFYKAVFCWPFSQSSNSADRCRVTLAHVWKWSTADRI